MRDYFIEVEKRIRTKSELVFYLEEIDRATEAVSKEADKSLVEKAEAGRFGYLRDIMTRLGSETGYQSIDRQILFLQLLRKHITLLPQVRMEVSFHPDEIMIDRMDGWLKRELGRKTVIDLMVNPAVVGGAMIEYEGVRTDLSIGSKIREMDLPSIETI